MVTTGFHADICGGTDLVPVGGGFLITGDVGIYLFKLYGFTAFSVFSWLIPVSGHVVYLIYTSRYWNDGGCGPTAQIC